MVLTKVLGSHLFLTYISGPYTTAIKCSKAHHFGDDASLNFTNPINLINKPISMNFKVNIWVRLNHATTHCHPLPPSNSQNKSTTSLHQPKYIHHQPPPLTTSQNISTTINNNPPTAKIYPPSPTTIQNISK